VSIEVPATLVKELREKTGAGILECKKVLTETGGDLEKAVLLLRQKGKVVADKKSSRTAREGLVHAYIHPPGRLGVLVEVNCETDFVARTEEFTSFAKDLAMHIAASAPLYIRREDVPSEVLEREKTIYAAQARNEGKPEKIIDRIVSGKLEKFFAEVCLLEQPFVKNQDVTIQNVLQELIAKTGENVVIRRFIRYKVGETLEGD
jgi:elongation factor Ts